MKKKNKVIKLKTRKSVAKRFKLTASGKVVRRGGQLRHLRANKTKRNIRRKKVAKVITNRMAKKIKSMLGR